MLLKILNLTKQLLTEGNWIKQYAALDKSGAPCNFDSKEACKFSLAGAIARVIYNEGYPDPMSKMYSVHEIILAFTKYRNIASFNDSSDYKTIIDTLDKVINVLQASN